MPLRLHALSWSLSRPFSATPTSLDPLSPSLPSTVARGPGFGRETRSWDQEARRALPRTPGAVPALISGSRVQRKRDPARAACVELSSTPRRGVCPPARPSRLRPPCQRHCGSAGTSRGWRGAASRLQAQARGRAGGQTGTHRRTLGGTVRAAQRGATRGPDGQGAPGHGRAGGVGAQAGLGEPAGAWGQRRPRVLPGDRR